MLCSIMGSVTTPALLRWMWAYCPPDHDVLKWIHNLAHSADKVERWRLRLTALEIYFVHRAGIKHQAAEALLQLKATGANQVQMEKDIPILCMTASIP